MIEDFGSFVPQEVELISAGTHIPALDATLPNVINWAINGEIEEAARRLSRYQPDCFAYYCTSISFARGPGMDLDISRRITAACGKPATTTSTAMIAALHALGITRVAVASPYLPDVERQFMNFLEAHQVKVLKSQSLHLPDGHSNVPPDQMAALVETCDLPEAEAIFVGCTGQRLAQHIEFLEAKLGKPVLTANQVTSWHALKLMGVSSSVPHRGSLCANRQLL
jgi:maleate isomerase